MTIYTLDCELETSATLADTFRFFEDPSNLARITPPWMGFRILTPSVAMRRGLEIDYQFRWLGLPLKWRTLISDYDPPHQFVDEAISSPYALWRHRHEFRTTSRGTLVRDHVEYALPLGFLGTIAHRIVVRKQVEEIFRYRQSTIGALLGGSVVEVSEPVSGYARI